jgi:hypothetical protein
MAARALILIPFVLVFSSGPGFFFLRRFRWNPLEKIAGSIALSLILLYGLTFGVYWTGLPRSAYYAVTAIAGALTLAALPDAWRLLRPARVCRILTAFGLLVAWTLGAQSLVRHYSGGDWCCDWVEHYQRTLFFLERWPKDFRFIDRYLVTARPPFMNVVCAYFLGNAGSEFALYQIVFSLLNLLAFFPCLLFARRFAPRVKELPWLVAIVLACNPAFFMNTTFPWTKVLTVFFVVLATWLYLAGWRKNDSTRMSAAFVCLAAGMLVHFSAAPYAVFLALAYVTTVWPWQRRRARALAIVALPAAALVAVWLAWSLREYGTTATFTANSTVEGTASATVTGNLVRISLNTFHTFWPYLFPGQPGDSPLRLLTDRAFTFYQENFLGAIGSVNAYVVMWIIGAALWSTRFPRFSRFQLSRRERLFWSAFIPFTILVGIAVDGETTLSGMANICLQPLVYLAATLVAARYLAFGRSVKVLVWCGLLADLILGIALEVYMESQMREWARTPNWDWKEREHLVYLGDLLRRSALSIEIALVMTAVAGFYYLGRVALVPADVRTRESVGPSI